jgi:exodeoxyribonuclease-3
VRIATWNVNSLKVRLPRVEEWLADMQPDVLCMQETKVSDDAFPALTFMSMGYESAHHGQGQWNGVAILSKVGLDDVVSNFATGEPDADARIITAMCGGVRVSSVYVPNGRSLEDAHYQYKLRWMAQLRSHVAALSSPTDAVVVAGDFNICPADIDVHDPAKFVGATHTSEPERAALADLLDWGTIDLFRAQHEVDAQPATLVEVAGTVVPPAVQLGVVVLGTKSVADRCTWSVIDRNARKGQLPSDHAPVIVELD